MLNCKQKDTFFLQNDSIFFIFTNNLHNPQIIKRL